MNLNAELFETEHSISLKQENNRVLAEVDGRKYELEIHQLKDNSYLLFSATNVYESSVEKSGESFTVHLRGLQYPIRIIDLKRLRSTASGSRHDHGSAEIVAPMPGKVVRLLVTEGAEVNVGTGILVVEAMKMQNELKSPKSGTVVSIRAQAGATVNAGDVLAVVE
jgi:biotin carboxyl carrier protein